MRILFTGGGSGGHFFPIIAVIRELKRIAEEEQILDLELFYMGPDNFGKEMLAVEEVYAFRVLSGKMRRYASGANILDMFKLCIGILQAVWNMFIVYPDVVFSKGGYGALPSVIAAAIFRIPLVIHESDAIPGKVSRFSARFAKRIGIAFVAASEYFPKEKTAVVGIPVRKRILGGNKEQAKESLGVFTPLPVIGFIGASQGALKINDAVVGILKELTDEYEVIHATGKTNFEQVKGEADVELEFGHKERYHAFGFLDEQQMREFYAACDLIVSRAGASSIFEIAAWSKPCILIPLLGSAQEHQLKNAYAYAAFGACQIIEEGNLMPHILLSEIKKIMDNPEMQHRMSESAQRFSRIDAGEIIAREILKLGLHEELQK